ncbi:hypothetical protein C8Q78DRAFT_1051459 [Trametes maxima]|nr:hypothetical protein C8Q78DRAFT_1051459 [Trametes maxima]
MDRGEAPGLEVWKIQLGDRDRRTGVLPYEALAAGHWKSKRRSMKQIRYGLNLLRCRPNSSLGPMDNGRSYRGSHAASLSFCASRSAMGIAVELFAFPLCMQTKRAICKLVHARPVFRCDGYS